MGTRLKSKLGGCKVDDVCVRVVLSIVIIAHIWHVTEEHNIASLPIRVTFPLLFRQTLLFGQQLFFATHAISAFLVEQSLPLVLDVDRSTELLLLLTVAHFFST